jgi:hypothetical protein
VLSALLLAAIGLLWGFTAYAANPIADDGFPGTEKALGLPCDGFDNDGGGTADDGYDDSDTDGTANCVDNDSDSDGDGLVDSLEDPDGNGFDPGDVCNVDDANTDGVSANDGSGNETAVDDTDGDGIRNCADDDNDNDGLTDDLEDANNNGVYDAGGECNLIVANTDGVSAKDGVGAEGTADTDGDGDLNCEDTNNDNDFLADDQEDLNNNGTFEAANDACNLDAANTDGVSANDGVGAEGTADTDGDGLQNCEDPNNDNDGLTDDLEDANNNGVYDAGGECNLIVANTDGVSAKDGVGAEGTADTDGDGDLNCEDPNNDGDALNDNAEDINNNGVYNAGSECNLDAANTDGQSANDGVGNETRTADTDGDGLRNCEDPDNDNDGLNDGAEDLDNSGTFNSTAECNLVNKNTDAVDGNDGDATETMADTDGDGRPNCNDTDNDNDGIVDTLDPTPNTAFDCNSAVKVKYLTSSVKFTAANQLKTVKVKITRNTGKPSVRLDSIDATATSPDIVDVTKVSPTLPKTINSSVTFTITVKGPAAGPFPVTVTFPTTEFTPTFPGNESDGEGAERLDYTFNCGTYIALGQPEQPAKLELRELRSYTYNSQLVFEALGQGVKALAVQLYDISGRGVLQAEANGSLVSVPLAGSSGKLSKGVYLAVLTVRGWDGQVIRSEIRKIVVK